MWIVSLAERYSFLRSREETKIVEYQEDRKNKIIKYNAMNYKENYVPPKMGKDELLEVERAILALSNGLTATANGQEEETIEYASDWE